MGEIQSGHISNHNALVTNTETFGDGGNQCLAPNQDEKFILDNTVATIACKYSPMMDGSVSGASMIPNTYASESSTDKESMNHPEY